MNSTDLDPATLVDNRLPLAGLTERNTLTAEADMAYTNTGRGCTESSTRSTGKPNLYAMSFPDQAQRIFAAFDQPDLRAPVTLTVTAPEHWTVAANGMLAATPRPRAVGVRPDPATGHVRRIADRRALACPPRRARA